MGPPAERNGKVAGIAQVTEKSELMLISQYGKIIRMDSGTIRESGHNGARAIALLNVQSNRAPHREQLLRPIFEAP